jgi:hypothetical protein
MIRLRQVASKRSVIVQSEVKLAIWYVGKRVSRSGTGRHRRRAILLRKGAFGSTQGSDAFAQTAFCRAETEVGLSKARYRLGISDGGGGCRRCSRSGCAWMPTSSITSTGATAALRQPACRGSSASDGGNWV